MNKRHICIFMMKTKIVVGAFVLGVVGCAGNSYVWVNPAKNSSQLSQDKSECSVHATRGVPDRNVTPQYAPPTYTTNCSGFGNMASCTTTPSGGGNTNALAQSIADMQTGNQRADVFRYCMEGRGWALYTEEQNETRKSQLTDKLEQYKLAFDRLRADHEENCKDPNLAPIAAKTPCNAKDINIAQMSDKSKASTKEKTAILYGEKVDEKEYSEVVDLIKLHMNPNAANDVIKYIDRRKAQYQKSLLDLYNGKITWGQFNIDRKNRAADGEAELATTRQKYNAR